jgi:hypothetical protein
MNPSLPSYEPHPDQATELNRPDSAPIKGFVLALIIDIVGTIKVALILLVAYVAYSYKKDPSVVTGDYSRLLDGFESSIFGIFATVLGVLLSAAGGFVCSRIARQKSMLLGLLLATTTTVFGFVMSHGSYSTMKNLFYTTVSFVAVLIGFYIGQKTNRYVS